jgi:putative effector of murein hydrolase
VDVEEGYVARGVAMGGSSHGVGTASLIQNGETRTAALSSVGMILTGVFHTIMCTLPPAIVHTTMAV